MTVTVTVSEFETERLRLRPWRPDEAPVLRELWLERDPRTPPHRRVGPDGRPTVADLALVVRDGGYAHLPALERRDDGDVIGYCGVIPGEPRGGTRPQIAFELLGRAQGQGYAQEAALPITERALAEGCGVLWASVWDWNAPSRRLLGRLGFTETGEREVDPGRGTTLWLARPSQTDL